MSVACVTYSPDGKREKDEYMKRIVNAIESRMFSSNKTVTSFANDPVRKEVAA